MSHSRTNPILVDSAIHMILVDDEPRIAHSAISKMLNLKPRYHLRQIERYLLKFESLGVLRFENAKPTRGSLGGRPERIALLNEDQCYLLVASSRNNEVVMQVKLSLVRAFRAAREAVAMRQQQYLPNFHQAHDAAHQMALYAAEHGSTTPASIHHMNIEKLINKTFGIDAGARTTLPPEVMSAVSTAYIVISLAIANTLSMGGDHKQAYQAAKERVCALAQLVLPTTTPRELIA